MKSKLVKNIWGVLFGFCILVWSMSGGTLLVGAKGSNKAEEKAIVLKAYEVSLFQTQKYTLQPRLKKSNKISHFSYNSENKKVASVSAKGVIKAKKKGITNVVIKAESGETVSVQVTVKSTDKLVALTFDDGPVYNNTKRILDTLKEYDYHATFFMVGYEVKPCKKLLKRMVAEGHEIGTHTWNHPNLQKLSKKEAKDNIQKSRKAIKQACGQYPTVLRPPYGSVDEKTLMICKDYGMPVIMWNTDVEDWKTSNVEKVKSNILNRVHPGAVLVIHDSHKSSADAIIKAIPELKKQGYELVTASELAALRGVELKPGEKFHGTNK